jgi:hypothetical protein
MRIGKSNSSSYRKYYQRRRQRLQRAIDRLCDRLDRLVQRAEGMRPGVVRFGLLERADRVREQLRSADH